MGRKGSQREPLSHRATVCGCIIIIIIIIIAVVVVNLGRSYLLTWILQNDRDHRVQGFRHTELLFSWRLKTSRPRNSSRGPGLSSGPGCHGAARPLRRPPWARWEVCETSWFPSPRAGPMRCAQGRKCPPPPATLLLEGPTDANLEPSSNQMKPPPAAALGTPESTCAAGRLCPTAGSCAGCRY